MGIIDSLSAGYRLLGRRWELLLLPILLDCVLWLTPRLSVAPLFGRLANFYGEAATMEGMPQDMAEMTQQVSAMLTEAGNSSNLLDMLASTSLLHVPSLLVVLGPVSERGVQEIANPFSAFLLFGGFGLVGIFLGVLYVNLLASKVPLGSGPKAMTPAEFGQMVLRHFALVLLYIVLMLILLIAGTVPVLLGTALLSLVSPLLGSIFIILLSGAIVVLFFYLYFVTVAVIMDNLPLHVAVGQSFVLVRNNFWATLGFMVLTNVIALGIALAIRQLATFMPAGMVVAIVVNAYIGTGLTMALLVFYRTRVLRMMGKPYGEPAGSSVSLEE